MELPPNNKETALVGTATASISHLIPRQQKATHQGHLTGAPQRVESRQEFQSSSDEDEGDANRRSRNGHQNLVTHRSDPAMDPSGGYGKPDNNTRPSTNDSIPAGAFQDVASFHSQHPQYHQQQLLQHHQQQHQFQQHPAQHPVPQQFNQYQPHMPHMHQSNADGRPVSAPTHSAYPAPMSANANSTIWGDAANPVTAPIAPPATSFHQSYQQPQIQHQPQHLHQHPPYHQYGSTQHPPSMSAAPWQPANPYTSANHPNPTGQLDLINSMSHLNLSHGGSVAQGQAQGPATFPVYQPYPLPPQSSAASIGTPSLPGLIGASSGSTTGLTVATSASTNASVSASVSAHTSAHQTRWDHGQTIPFSSSASTAPSMYSMAAASSSSAAFDGTMQADIGSSAFGAPTTTAVLPPISATASAPTLAIQQPPPGFVPAVTNLQQVARSSTMSMTSEAGAAKPTSANNSSSKSNNQYDPNRQRRSTSQFDDETENSTQASHDTRSTSKRNKKRRGGRSKSKRSQQHQASWGKQSHGKYRNEPDSNTQSRQHRGGVAQGQNAASMVDQARLPVSHTTANQHVDDGRTIGTDSAGSSKALNMLMKPSTSAGASLNSTSTQSSRLTANRLDMDHFAIPDAEPSSPSSFRTFESSATQGARDPHRGAHNRLALPTMEEYTSFDSATVSSSTTAGTGIATISDQYSIAGGRRDGPSGGRNASFAGDESFSRSITTSGSTASGSTHRSKQRDWLLRMNRERDETPIGQLDAANVPIPAIMNAWAKTKSEFGASMVETWLKRAQQESEAGNAKVAVNTKLYTMAVDAWAKSGKGGDAAQRAETILQQMNQKYRDTGDERIKPTTGIFNAVINAWARSKERIAPSRAEEILKWMQRLNQSADPSIQPDKFTFNTVMNAYAKSGGSSGAKKAQQLLANMHRMYEEGNNSAKPDTITYNIVIDAWAKSGGKGAAIEAERLLSKMHRLQSQDDTEVRPNVVTYGAVIDAYAKSGEKGAAARADSLLAQMIQLHQSDPIGNAKLEPNTHVFNAVINAWAKSKERDAAHKAEEMLVAMGRLHAEGSKKIKPDSFTYTATIDAWAKSGYRGAATRADQLLEKMEAKYMAGDIDLKPNAYTYNAVIQALAKSGEADAAARAERVLQNMVNRHRIGHEEDVKPTTINFNTVLDAWAKSGRGRQSAERSEQILEWMDKLHQGGNKDVKPDTITYNNVLDAWARSGDPSAPHRAERIVDLMDDLYRSNNNKDVKPDTYTYNTLINVWAKSSERGSAARAEEVFNIMETRYKDGDAAFKPNTRTYTSVIDAWAKSGEKGAAQRAEEILNGMIVNYEKTKDADIKPNVHTSNAVCNACAFTKFDEDRHIALQIAFRVFDWLSNQQDMAPDAYTYTILLSVVANLLPREDHAARYMHARAFFEKCCESGYVNDYVLGKLRHTVTEEEYLELIDYRADVSISKLPPLWTRNVTREARYKANQNSRRKGGRGGRGGRGGSGGRGGWNSRRRGGRN